MLPTILVAGTSSVGKSSLIRRIKGGEANDDKTEVPWLIDTKYYHASTRMKEITLSLLSTDQITPDHDQPEALILVVSCMDESSFQSATRWFHGQYSAEEEESPGARSIPEICLLVVNKVDQIKGLEERPSWISEKSLSWSCQHGFELIEISATDEQIDVTLEVDGDFHGVKRVVEALHSHQWSSMVEKKREGGNATMLQAERIEVEVEEEGGEKEDREGEGEGEGHDIDERELDAFERLMDEMANAKERLRGLPDDQRREEAAALAMKFAAMLGEE